MHVVFADLSTTIFTINIKMTLSKTKLIEQKFREGKITKRQFDKILEHCEHHGMKHIQAMLGPLEADETFKNAHKHAMSTVGK